MAELRYIPPRPPMVIAQIPLNRADMVHIITQPQVLLSLSDDQLEMIEAAIVAEQGRRMQT